MSEEENGNGLADAFYGVAEKINSKDWNEFARRILELSDNVVDDITHDYRDNIKEQKYQMLCKWKGKLSDTSDGYAIKKINELCENFKIDSPSDNPVHAQMNRRQPKVLPVTLNKTESDGQLASIRRISQPMKDLKETQMLCNIYENVRDQQFQILHCHGVPGSGKSQAVLKLSEKFNRDNKSSGKAFVEWHIRCLDGDQNVKESLKKLAEELLRKKLIKNDKMHSINDDLDNGGAGVLIRTLCNCAAHVLILIEDPQSKCKELLRDLCRHLSAKSNETRECKFHLYLTSRRRQQILTASEIGKISIYRTELLKGFSEKEAIDFLHEASNCVTDDGAAKEIFMRFSGLPLGLKAAREYCKQSHKNYRGYLNSVKEDELELEEEEKEIIREDFGSSAQHVFQAIVMPFKPDVSIFRTSENVPKSLLHWQILCCLSYFHHECVPQSLVERCCYLLADEQTRKRKTKIPGSTGQLITKLEEYGMCSTNSEHEIRLHQVVLNAFRVHHQSSDSDKTCMFVKTAIEVLCSLVSKDLRKKGSYSRLSKLRPHMQSLLRHVDPSDKRFSDKDLLLYKALLSHLSEVTATIMMSESPSSNEESNKYFEKAIQLLWEDDIQKVVCDCDHNIDDFSNTVVQKSAAKGVLLPLELTLDYASKLIYCFDETKLDFAKSLCGDECKDVETIFQMHASKKKLIKQLQDCDVFLRDKDYRRIFYAERLASILHSWSRSILDADSIKVKEDAKSAWRSSLSRSVSIQCRLLHEVPLLCEWLTVTGSIAIWLKQKRGSDYLKKASSFCREILSEDPEKCIKTYENGLVAEVSFPFLRSTMTRFLVRIYTRRKDLSSDEIEKGNALCDKLYESSLANVENYSNSLSCIIYCAKYFASRSNFVKASECFDKYFSIALLPDYTPKGNNYSWAVYNYARAVNSNSNPPESEREDVISKCEEVLNSNVALSEDLNKRLNVELQTLK